MGPAGVYWERANVSLYLSLWGPTNSVTPQHFPTQNRQVSLIKIDQFGDEIDQFGDFSHQNRPIW